MLQHRGGLLPREEAVVAGHREPSRLRRVRSTTLRRPSILHAATIERWEEIARGATRFRAKTGASACLLRSAASTDRDSVTPISPAGPSPRSSPGRGRRSWRFKVVGFGVGRRGSGRRGAIGEIFGVNGQAHTEGDPPMALSQSALSELLEAFRAGDGVDLVRDSVRMVMQELIEAEATERIGAGRYERTDARVTDRNGARPRLLATQAGDVELRIPKLRRGRSSPSILEPRRRIDQALYAVVMEAYVHGVSTRSGGRPGRGHGRRGRDLQVRGVADLRRARRVVGAFRTRPLDHIEFPYVYLDATYLHVGSQQPAALRAGGVDGRGRRHRDRRRGLPGDPRPRRRRQRRRGLLARLPHLRSSSAAWAGFAW